VSEESHIQGKECDLEGACGNEGEEKYVLGFGGET